MSRRQSAIVACLLLLAGCSAESPQVLTGTTEWDRVAVLAEASEPVVAWHVREGQAVAQGEVLLELDPIRYDARIGAVEARRREAAARLAELQAGPRPQTIERAEAELASADAAQVEAELQFARAEELVGRELAPQATLDQARAARDQRRAAAAASRAVLAELRAGTRAEQLTQAAAQLDAISSELEELKLSRNRLTIRAPRAGRVDVLPFEPGDQPKTGDELVILLVGETPYARLFIPASIRAAYQPGDRFLVEVLGVNQVFDASLRTISREASFTPYYALSGDDASRLVFRAELAFTGQAAAGLPAGLPLTATPRAPGANDD